MSWQSQLENPREGHHFVQVYKTQSELLAPLLHYIGTGLKRGEGVILVVAKPHREALSMALSGMNFDLESLAASGQLSFFDSDEMLSKIFEKGEISRDRFFLTLDPILEQVRSKFKEVRAFGEMVDMLWRAGKLSAAMKLESLWDELMTKHSFSLLCAYQMDNFATGEEGTSMKQVSRAHTHFIPATDYERLEKSVATAIDGVLGGNQANMLRSIVAAQKDREAATEMPLSQCLLMWLKENMPVIADKVLLRAKAQYESDSATPGYYA